MRHILTFSSPGGEKPLPAMCQWSAPNLVCFSRAARPPVASLVARNDDLDPSENEETDAGVAESVSGSKRSLRGMSVKSSLNVARMLSTLDWFRLGRCLHVTLTYWKDWPRSKREVQLVKMAIAVWFARNAECGVWRLEFHAESETRGEVGERVPHWHVLAFIGVRCEDDFQRLCRAWWAKGCDGNEHKQAVKFSDGDGRASYYLAMHAGKRNQAPPFEVGRWWGYINRAVLLESQRISPLGQVLERERVWWSRLYRRKTGCKTRNAGGFSWFLSAVGQQHVRAWVAARIEHEMRTRAHGGRPF